MVQFIDIFRDRNSVRIIEFFIKNPSATFSQREIREKLELAKATAVKHLGMLVKNSFLNLKTIGNSNQYCLNNENVIIKQIKILSIIIELESLSRLKEPGCEIYLYGSAARGEINEKSDIDLLIIGKIKRSEIIREIEKLSKSIDKKISYNIFTPLEWSKMAKLDKAYYERVEKDKVKIA